LDAAAQATGSQLLVRDEVAELDISLLLPSATSGELLQALMAAYNLSLAPIPLLEGGGLEVGRGGDLDITTRMPLNYLTPENARLLFPDFMLPRLRVDAGQNSLLATGTPRMVARIARDVELLDQPRPQVRVEASAWEITGGASLDLALRIALDGGGNNLGGVLDLEQGQAAIVVDPAKAKALSVALTALGTQSRARLTAKPFVQVASGQSGLLFSGQNRFITVLRRRRGQQNVESVKLQIGYSLEVTPRVGGSEKDAEILLQLHPTVSNVEEIEEGTGLPTLSLREVETTVRVRPGDTVILAGLDSQFEAKVKRGFLAPAPARRDFESRTSLIFLVTVQRAD
jgi:type IV pilus assembly protein PilQ